MLADEQGFMRDLQALVQSIDSEADAWCDDDATALKAHGLLLRLGAAMGKAGAAEHQHCRCWSGKCQGKPRSKARRKAQEPAEPDESAESGDPAAPMSIAAADLDRDADDHKDESRGSSADDNVSDEHGHQGQPDATPSDSEPEQASDMSSTRARQQEEPASNELQQRRHRAAQLVQALLAKEAEVAADTDHAAKDYSCSLSLPRSLDAVLLQGQLPDTLLPPPVAGSGVDSERQEQEGAARKRKKRAIWCINQCLAFAGNLSRAALRCHYVLGYLLSELKTLHGNIRGASSSAVVTFDEFLRRGNLELSKRFVQTHIKWYGLCSTMPGLTDIAAKGWTEVKLLMMNDVLKTAVSEGAAQAAAAHSRHGQVLSASPAGHSAADEPMADVRAAVPQRAEARPTSVKGRPSQPSAGDKRSRADQVSKRKHKKKQKAESESRSKSRAEQSDAEQQEDQEAVKSHVEEEAVSASLDAEQENEEEKEDQLEEEEGQEEDQQQEEEDQQKEEENQEDQLEAAAAEAAAAEEESSHSAQSEAGQLEAEMAEREMD